MCLVTFTQPAEFILLSSLQLPAYLASTDTSSCSLHLRLPLPILQQNTLKHQWLPQKRSGILVTSLSAAPFADLRPLIDSSLLSSSGMASLVRTACCKEGPLMEDEFIQSVKSQHSVSATSTLFRSASHSPPAEPAPGFPGVRTLGDLVAV